VLVGATFSIPVSILANKLTTTAQDIFDLCDPTVRAYIHAFEKGGPGALHDAPHSGRPGKLPKEYDGSPQAQENWRELLDRRPATITELETNLSAWSGIRRKG
jgi:hypothetical protein